MPTMFPSWQAVYKAESSAARCKEESIRLLPF
ncbi:hypothetical protein KY496_17375 [Massilia sp. NP310]|nr:hypothetical protein KY496_17375 [Massilia sp. NP310]